MRSLAMLGSTILMLVTAAIEGPVGDVLPYAAAAGALGIIIKAMSFLNTYQDRIVDGLIAQLAQARIDIETMRTSHAADIEAIRSDARHEVEHRDRYIAYLLGQIEDVRRQAGLPERRLPPPPTFGDFNDPPDPLNKE